MCASNVVSVFPVSQAPKEAPVRKYLPSSVYLEEKTDEQKKEEVRGLYIIILFFHLGACSLTFCVRVCVS